MDLSAIREDIDMAARSPEMAKHVALDHGPELIAEIEMLRGERKGLSARLRTAKKDRDRLQARIAAVQALADDLGHGCISCSSATGGDHLADALRDALWGES